MGEPATAPQPKKRSSFRWSKAETKTKPEPDYTPSGPLFDVDAAADYLAISVSHLRTLDSQGVGPRRTRLPSRCAGTGKLVHFAKADLDAWINAHRVPQS